MIPDFQKLMRPVLEASKDGEIHIKNVRQRIVDKIDLSEEELKEKVPSGYVTRFADRVAWAKAHLKGAGLLKQPRRGYVVITDRGRNTLEEKCVELDIKYLERFEEYRKFRRGKKSEPDVSSNNVGTGTPYERLSLAYEEIADTRSADLLDRVRNVSADFFEQVIVDLLVAMGYGISGRRIGQSGDGGVDGVIDQDPLGVDQIYVQAKRYDKNPVGAGAIRDFFGALNLKRAQKGVFITSSFFTRDAVETAKGLGGRIVLVDGERLAKLMFRYNIGCRDQETFHLKEIDEEFFDPAE